MNNHKIVGSASSKPYLSQHDGEQNTSDGDANHERRKNKTRGQHASWHYPLKGRDPHENCRGRYFRNNNNNNNNRKKTSRAAYKVRTSGREEAEGANRIGDVGWWESSSDIVPSGDTGLPVEQSDGSLRAIV